MTKIKKKHMIPQQTYLSDDLIIQEILTRLPIKSIIRFKSVSKQWYSTLSSPDFAKAHLMKSPFSHPSAPVNTLFIKCGNNINNYCYLLSYNDDQIGGNFEDNLVKLDSDLWVEKYDLELTGCCSGLVCLTPFSKKYFIIWNPATRKIYKYESVGYGKLTRSIICGFGYSSSVDDYKYVRIVKLERGNNCVHIFSLRENKWRKIDFHHNASFLLGLPVIVNEKLYWRAHCSQAGYVTLSFDLGVETFDMVKGRDYYLGLMGGCLSKCNPDSAKSGSTNDDMLIHIFESPSIVKTIGLPKGLSLGVASQMIGFTRTDKFFVTGPLEDEAGVWRFQNKTLGIVDTSTKPVQYARLLRFDKMITIARYVPSRVSPFPIEDPSRA